PAALARLHFDGQTQSAGRQYLLVKGGGHNPFRMNMGDCYKTVFATMATQGKLADSLSSCAWPDGFELTTVQDGTSTTQPITGRVGLGLAGVDQLFDNTTTHEQLIKPLRGLLMAP